MTIDQHSSVRTLVNDREKWRYLAAEPSQRGMVIGLNESMKRQLPVDMTNSYQICSHAVQIQMHLQRWSVSDSECNPRATEFTAFAAFVAR